MNVVAVIVDFKDLGYTVVASVIAATAITIAISLAIRGAARYAELSQHGRSLAGYGALALASVSATVALALVALGLFVMIAN
jgi:hypothetical protein